MIRNITSGESKLRPSELAYFFKIISLTSSTKSSSLIMTCVADDPGLFTHIFLRCILADIGGGSIEPGSAARSSGLSDFRRSTIRCDWDLSMIDCPLCIIFGRFVRASASARWHLSSAGGPSTLAAFPERPFSVGVGASKANFGIFLLDGGVLGVSRLVAGVCCPPPIAKISKGVVGDICGKGSVSSKTGIGREGLRFLDSRGVLLLQLRPSPNGVGAVVESDAEDLADEKVELRRKSGFRRAFRSLMIPSYFELLLPLEVTSYIQLQQVVTPFAQTHAVKIILISVVVSFLLASSPAVSAD